jgi:VCBS repeat-containing protein
LRRAEPGPTPFSAQGQNSSSYRGTLSFTEVDAKDLVTITTAYNTDAVWSAGTLTAAQITAITSGFTADSNSWDYTVSNAALDFLGAGESITLSFNVKATDATEAMTIPRP